MVLSTKKERSVARRCALTYEDATTRHWPFASCCKILPINGATLLSAAPVILISPFLLIFPFLRRLLPYIVFVHRLIYALFYNTLRGKHRPLHRALQQAFFFF